MPTVITIQPLRSPGACVDDLLVTQADARSTSTSCRRRRNAATRSRRTSWPRPYLSDLARFGQDRCPTRARRQTG